MSTRLTANELQITVTDHGPGLSPEEWESVLQPLHRIRGVPRDGHTGLGLALVQRLVAADRGKLSARRISDGFLVEVILPALDQK